MNSKKFDPNALKRATSIINKLPNSNLHDAPEQPVAAPNEYLDGILTFGPPGQGKTSGIIAAAKEMAVPEEAAQKAALLAAFDALDEMSAIVATNFRHHGPSDSSNRPVDTTQPDGTNDSFGM